MMWRWKKWLRVRFVEKVSEYLVIHIEKILRFLGEPKYWDTFPPLLFLEDMHVCRDIDEDNEVNYSKKMKLYIIIA